jgi:hypothetical protein
MLAYFEWVLRTRRISGNPDNRRERRPGLQNGMFYASFHLLLLPSGQTIRPVAGEGSAQGYACCRGWWRDSRSPADFRVGLRALGDARFRAVQVEPFESRMPERLNHFSSVSLGDTVVNAGTSGHRQKIARIFSCSSLLSANLA